MHRATPSNATTRLARLARRSTVGLMERCGLLRRHIRGRHALRILCYHGVCGDDVAAEPWVPSYFVSAKRFSEQMEMLSRAFSVVHLPEVFNRWTDQPRPVESCVAVTFDDVAACSFETARPILRRYGIHASFFVSTGHVETSRLFDANVLELLQWRPDLAGDSLGNDLRRMIKRPNSHKRMDTVQLRRILDGAERTVSRTAPARVVEALRPVDWNQVRTLAADGHAIGGHTVDHSILGWQSLETRRAQIEDCIRELRQRLAAAPSGFAYPNGGPGDFDRVDQRILEQCGVRYAASTRAGFCDSGTNPYDLPRVCIGMEHTRDRFALEVSGLLDRRRRRQQGWG